MIKKINHKEAETSHQIYTLFQASYRIEAKLLKVDDFPPLRRTIDDFISSNTEFYAYWKNNEIAAIVEILRDNKCTDIHSLVVYPKYFRQGLGKELMTFLLDTIDAEIFTVETGLENTPATRLYKKMGFQEVEQWDTEFGIRKIKFKKSIQ